MTPNDPPKLDAWMVRNASLVFAISLIIAVAMAISCEWIYAITFAALAGISLFFHARYRKRWPEYAKAYDEKLRKENAERKKNKQAAKQQKKAQAKASRLNSKSNKRAKRCIYVRVAYGDPGVGHASSGLYTYRWYESDLGTPKIGDWVWVDAMGDLQTAQIRGFGRGDWPYETKVVHSRYR